MGRANGILRLCLLDFCKGGKAIGKRHFVRTHRACKSESVDKKDGEARAGLNFHTSNIKLYGGIKSAETVRATAQLQSNEFTPQGENDNLPF